jgi:2-keto-myo-inositol isomerase
MPDFTYCLNTSSISGQGLSLIEEIDVAAKAGYGAIEPWIREIVAYRAAGGSLRDLRARLSDLGLTVPSAIGFAHWIVDDDAQRARGFEEAKRDMELLSQIGATGLACPPAGAQDAPGLNLLSAAERYGQLVDLGRQFGIVPMVEFWGFAKALHTLGEAVLVALESGRSDACVLADVYHLHRGGSTHECLHLLSGSAIRVLHMNDYPAQPSCEKLTDADRVWPGDGVAPLKTIVHHLRRNRFAGTLSLELFNEHYWKLDALRAATIGLEKMRQVVETAP